MQVTFLDHSGFLVELDSAALLFDWWKGELPAIKPGVPLYVFASHVHPDHFDPRIFTLDDGSREVRFILGHDIKLSSRNFSRWGVSPETAEKCRNLRGGETLELSGVSVEALPSTDEGEAFLVTADGRTVFHAGDLNWWHWEGEDKGWNRNMEVNFKKPLIWPCCLWTPGWGRRAFGARRISSKRRRSGVSCPCTSGASLTLPGNFWKSAQPLQTASCR